MEMEYRFGIGKIGQVLKGEVDKTESLNELEVNESQGSIIVPQVIGIYQYYRGMGAEKFRDTMTQYEFFLRTGQEEEMSKDLICVAYDPTIIPGDMLVQTLDRDVLGRLKAVEYCSLEGFPKFYEKKCPTLDIIIQTEYDPSKSNIAILERDRNLLEMAREEFGLTRFEALGLEAAKIMLIKLGKLPGMVNEPRLIKSANKDALKELKGFDFKGFLRRERFLRGY